MQTISRLKQINQWISGGNRGRPTNPTRIWSGMIISITTQLLIACTGRSTLAEPVNAIEADAALNVRQQLAQQLQVDLAAINVVSTEPVVWPDACLGKPDPVGLCAPNETPGYKLVLEVKGERYGVHSDASGEQMRIAEAPQPVTSVESTYILILT